MHKQLSKIDTSNLEENTWIYPNFDLTPLITVKIEKKDCKHLGHLKHFAHIPHTHTESHLRIFDEKQGFCTFWVQNVHIYVLMDLLIE